MISNVNGFILVQISREICNADCFRTRNVFFSGMPKCLSAYGFQTRKHQYGSKVWIIVIELGTDSVQKKNNRSNKDGMILL